MLTYLHGWRRKMGVATLVMACVFMVGRTRSLHYIDAVDFGSGWNRSTSIISVDSSIYWANYNDKGYDSSSLPKFGCMEIPHSPVNGTYWNPRRYWGINLNGLRTGRLEVSVDQVDGAKAVRCGLVHYMTLVIPLTLLSAYLLLVPARPKPKPQPDRQPVA